MVLSDGASDLLPRFLRRGVRGAPLSYLVRRGAAVRVSEVRLLVLITAVFAVMCITTLFLLPDLRAGINAGLDVRQRVGRLGDSLLMPPGAELQVEEPRVAVDDKARLVDRVRAAAVLPPPLHKPQLISRSSSISMRPAVGGGNVSALVVGAPHAGMSASSPVLPSGEDPDPITRSRRDKIKQMFLHAWRGYSEYAWGYNEVRPVSLQAHTGSVFGRYPLGATIVDAMDTLLVMGLTEEFEKGRQWIRDSLNMGQMNVDLSVFETNIRYVGGLLSCYALTGDPLFREKAVQVVSVLMPAFNTPLGIPYSLINPITKRTKNFNWAVSSSSILSEIGTLHMEMAYLSDITANRLYVDLVDRIRKHLKQLTKPDGLYPNYLNPSTGQWTSRHVSVGALGDSFYEYLLKEYLRSGGVDQEARSMYDEAIYSITNRLLHTSKPSGLTYLAELRYEALTHKMDHLACFIGGLYALGSVKNANEKSGWYMEVAKGVTETCHESYNRTATGLGPEIIRFSDGVEARALKSQERAYLLRPETIESYFILWRLTGDTKYREWAWQAAEAIEKYCRARGGYSGIRNVESTDTRQDDVQQSYFLAETLKYLYLIFSDDSLLPLDQWVFNTEAHPLPIKGVNQMYRGVV